MSAWMVSETHIDCMLTAGLAAQPYGVSWYSEAEENERDGHRKLDYLNADQVGAMLLAENRASVNYRYSEEELEELYTFRRLLGTPDPVTALKAIECYEYQACEHPEWKTSEARRFCSALRTAVIGMLPGMDAAPWGVDDRNVFMRPAGAH